MPHKTNPKKTNKIGKAFGLGTITRAGKKMKKAVKTVKQRKKK